MFNSRCSENFKVVMYFPDYQSSEALYSLGLHRYDYSRFYIQPLAYIALWWLNLSVSVCLLYRIGIFTSSSRNIIKRQPSYDTCPC